MIRPEVRHTISIVTTPAFDTHKALKEAGFDHTQAEAVVATVGDAIGGNVATKADIAEVKGEPTPVKWMLGVNLAFSTALLLRTFFAHVLSLSGVARGFHPQGQRRGGRWLGRSGSVLPHGPCRSRHPTTFAGRNGP